MYTDYEVTYESHINEFLIPILIGIGILIVILIISLIALMRIFKKANRSEIAALIPIYNLAIMLEIVNKARWQLVLLLIPFLNLIIYGEIMFKIAKSFRKTNAFAIGTIFFPFIFLPILGFSDSEYIGINKEAMIGSSTALDIPIVTEEEQQATPVAEKKETKPLDISIGGGVYQKDYEESLLQVPEAENKNSTLASFRVETEPTPIPEEPEKTGMDLLNNINFIDEEAKNEKTNLKTQEEIIPINPIPTVIEYPNLEANASKELESDSIIPVIENASSAKNQLPEYIPCPHCGAMIKSDAPKCFMCGKDLNEN